MTNQFNLADLADLDALAPLTLFYHPLAAFCWKVLLALYENDTPFVPRLVDLGDPVARARLASLWPLRKLPVLRDDVNDRTIPESTIIIEYLERHHPGAVPLIPSDSDRAREARGLDRFYDLHVSDPMQKIVTDRLRPTSAHDPHGVEQARAALETAYGVIDRDLRAGSDAKPWAMGADFSLVDCAAAPALYYANLVQPLGDRHPNAAAYLARLMTRPSFMRVFHEAQPYFVLFPG